MECLIPRRIWTLMEQFCLRLLQCGRIRDLLKVHLHVVLLLRDVFEDQRMAMDVNVRLRDLPYMRAKFSAFHVKGASGLEISQQAISDLDVVDQATFQAGNAMLFAVDRHITLHARKYSSLELGG